MDWLEKNARSNLSHFPEKIHYYADEVTWENTFHKLQYTRDLQEIHKEGHLVTEMVRKAFERYVCMYVCMYVRTGP